MTVQHVRSHMWLLHIVGDSVLNHSHMWQPHSNKDENNVQGFSRVLKGHQLKHQDGEKRTRTQRRPPVDGN